jgi:2-polyprenyl-3-methyl-5-hydroxy-6-metoxy-1,4-benzoquinol methylase
MLPPIPAQRDYYSNRWRESRHADAIDLARMAQVLKFMTRIELSKDPMICDLGCGAGWTTGILGVFGNATGVDLADTTLAQSRFQYCQFHSANILEWDYPRAKFDIVTSIEVVEHIEYASQSRYIAIACGLLKPGGYLIVTTPNKRTMEAIPGGGRTWSNQPIENWISATELRSLLAHNGFGVIASRSLVVGIGALGSYRIVNSHKVNALLAALGLKGGWERMACRANYGLHLAVLARRF